MKEREAEWAGLMHRAIAGDAGAYQTLLAALTPILRAIAARGLVRAGFGQGDAEDIVQETLLAIHLKRHTWDVGRPIWPWIHAVARNKLIDNLRRRGRYDVPIEGFEEILPATQEEMTPKPTNIDALISALPRRQREVIGVLMSEETSIRQAAMKLDMSEGAVRVALHRGLAALAEKYKESAS